MRQINKFEDYKRLSEKIITRKGPEVAILFALKIVETLKSKELADELAEEMIVKPLAV